MPAIAYLRLLLMIAISFLHAFYYSRLDFYDYFTEFEDVTI